MKKIAILLILSLWLGAAAYAACTIVDTEKTESGADKGIEGYCSNNRQPITCTYEEGEGWTCTGPNGGYSELGEELDEAVIASACGC